MYKLLPILFIIIATNITPITAQTLDDYINIALQNSSKIKIKKYKVALAKEAINEVTAIDDIYLDFGISALSRETYTGSEIFKTDVSIELPWLNEVATRKKLKREKFARQQIAIQLSAKELTFKVKELYYTLYQKQASREALKDSKELINSYEDMITSSMENNLSSLNDVLEVTIEKNKLHSQIFQTYNEIEALSKNFNRLLEREDKEELNIPISLNVLDLLAGKNKIEGHPLLKNLKQFESIYKTQTTLIKLEQKPRLSIGLEYTLVNTNPYPNIINNGKDILLPKVSLKIPVNRQKYRAQRQQLKIKQEQLSSQITDQKVQLNMAIETAELTFDNALVQVVALQKNLIETQRVIDLYIQSFDVKSFQYIKILKLQLQKLNFQLMEIDATKNAFIAKARLDFLRGEE